MVFKENLPENKTVSIKCRMNKNFRIYFFMYVTKSGEGKIEILKKRRTISR